MLRQPQKIRVFPNPWGVHPRALFDEKGVRLTKLITPSTFTMDPQGRPSGIVLEEARSRTAPTVARYVGGRIDDERTRKLQKLKRGDNLRSERQETVFSFMGATAHETEPHAVAKALTGKTPVDLVFSQYLRDRVLDGSLIAADAATAKACGVRFLDPKSLFLPLSEAAARAFNAQFDESGDVYAELCAARAEAAKAPQAPAPPVTEDIKPAGLKPRATRNHPES